jgi:hypothetical protein
MERPWNYWEEKKILELKMIFVVLQGARRFGENEHDDTHMINLRWSHLSYRACLEIKKVYVPPDFQNLVEKKDFIPSPTSSSIMLCLASSQIHILSN